MRLASLPMLVLPLFLAHEGGFAGTVSGFVSIESRKGNADPAGALVWLEGGPGPVPAPRHETITTKGKAFSPRLLVVPPGSTVTFPNGDTIRHNVFSLSEGNAFDLGLYGEGDSREACRKRWRASTHIPSASGRQASTWRAHAAPPSVSRRSASSCGPSQPSR